VSNTLRAQVSRLNAASIKAVTQMMKQGNGTYLVEVHGGQIVSTAKVSRPERVPPGAPGDVEVIIKQPPGA